VHARNADFIRAEQAVLERSLTDAGHEVVVGAGLLDGNTPATPVARGVAAADVDPTVLHYAVWSFPHFTMLAADATRGPPALMAGTDAAESGMAPPSRPCAARRSAGPAAARQVHCGSFGHDAVLAGSLSLHSGLDCFLAAQQRAVDPSGA
jgi:L-fucose isomerase